MYQPSAYIPKTSAQKREEAEMEEKKNSLLSIFLTPDAKERLRRIEIVSPERASRVEAILLQQMQRGQLSPQSVSDDMLKGLLEQLTDVHTRGLVVGGIDVADEATGSGRVIISRRGADAFMGVGDSTNLQTKSDDEELSF
ncbi:Double-stranded DNA-binding domain-containing protein [Giardia duodenalis]|uniref:Double-stranded DNA-binding domain-containing protein n=1 Tax=Giardia intestinalis (strain ATCC 50803 / WB clone C6) TaxID=184922 RepID=A8B956_GIAIC|nr:Double-stranded DNA-binding domain-containing protein [Giardia intestinalis]KAE8302325.1 Double-stranded DNA-binding domain-containing protein [Giardia intestinalis]|eukprot:XP_001708772.1 Hypothetical protein GL50803_10679 [Giardia lamblia ATCC 50803]